MVNTTNPFGFRAFGHRDGSAPTAGLERYWIYSSDAVAVFTGDPVALSSATYGYLQVYGGSTLTPKMVGVFAGCEFYSPSVGKVVWSSYFPGTVSSSSPVTAYVISDPEMMFLAQASSANGANAGFGSSMIGGNVNVSSGAGNTLSGISGYGVLSTGGLTAASSYPWTVVDVYSNFAPPGVNGTDNSSAYNILVVAPNNWTRKAGVTGVTT